MPLTELAWMKDCDRCNELEADIITLVLRLKGEDPDTFSPEVAGVMAKWLPDIDAGLFKEE